MSADELTVLHVDDDSVDREAVKRALRGLASVTLVAASNGAEGLERIRETRGRVLVLLDLNMPVLDGFGFLAAMRAEPGLAATVVFVLSTSNREADITAAFAHGVAGYLCKADVFDQMSHLASLVEAFTAVVRLPASG